MIEEEMIEENIRKENMIERIMIKIEEESLNTKENIKTEEIMEIEEEL